jgi:Secretion system C-terminal sorting domain
MSKLSILIFLLIPFNLFCQILSPEVISSGGDFYEQLNGSVSITIGEPIIETYSDSNVVLTQGFQQSNYYFVGLKSVIPPDVSFELFPNPTIDKVNVKISQSEPLKWELKVFDISGKLILSKVLDQNEIEIDFNLYSATGYIVNLINAKNDYIKSFKVIKIK